VRHLDPWSAADADQLLADADCYLALHRADGGLGAVAKAMAWGTYTVVTATPASLELQTDRDSGLVHSEAATIPPGEYRYPRGAVWAEPDLAHASALLRAVAAEPALTAAKVGRARQVAGRRFSRSLAATTVRARLSDIESRLSAGRKSDRVRVGRTRDHAAGRR
jgi:glycosyltransferase involved in cell wall biosynthesis